MAYSFTAASKQYLNHPLLLAGGSQSYAMAAWFYATTSNNLTLFSMGNKDDVNSECTIFVNNSNQLGLYAPGTVGNIIASAAYLPRRWNFAFGQRNNTGPEWSIHINATSSATSSGNFSLTGNATRIGKAAVNNDTNYWQGLIAHVSIWNCAFNINEIRGLYNNGLGADPRLFKSGSLLAYWPLMDSGVDFWGNYDMVPVNGPIAVANTFNARPRFPTAPSTEFYKKPQTQLYLPKIDPDQLFIQRGDRHLVEQRLKYKLHPRHREVV